MVSLSLTIAPLITGAIYVMANPTLTSTSEIVENAQREFHVVPTRWISYLSSRRRYC